jgi:Right handed beta helix region/Secretion system C-terminal sorting domain
MKSVYLFLLLLLIPVPASATSWLVMQDGSGDYTEIQAAVDGCSVGDTVLVGPGIYDTFRTYWPDFPMSEVIAVVEIDSVTIKGFGREYTVLGPETGNRSLDRYGILATDQVSWVTIEDLAVQNMRSGITFNNSGHVKRCESRGCYSIGIRANGGEYVLIENVTSHGDGYGIGLLKLYFNSDPGTAIVRNCTAYGGEHGFLAIHPDARFMNCRTVDLTGVGFVSQQHATASMSQCASNGCFRGVAISLFASLTVSDCVFQNSLYNDIYVDTGYLYGTGNVLHGGCMTETIKFGNGAASFHGNRIEESNGHSLNVFYHISPGAEIDFSGNYWGTSDPNYVAALIWDGVDDPSLGVTVDYLPLQPAEAWSAIEDTPSRTPIVLEVFPNPFNPSTTIRFSLEGSQHTKVAVYDVSGRLIKTLLDEFTSGGERTINWNGRDGAGRAVSSGSYFVRLQSDRTNEVRKVTLLR